VGVNDPENTSLRDCDPEENLAGAAGRNLDKRERERESEIEKLSRLGARACSPRKSIGLNIVTG